MMAYLPNRRSTTAEISGSSPLSSRGLRPKMVTTLPMAEKKCPYSQAMYPPPMMIRLSGGFSSSRSETLSIYPASASPGIGGTRGRDPQAMTNLGAVMVSLPARSV